jgi:hypothetical protein
MKNIVNYVIKSAFILLVLYFMIPLFGKSTWTQTLITGLILAALAYIIGDLWVLAKFGNLGAVVVDFGINALVIWMMMKGLPQFVLTSAGVWTISVVLTLGELLFHRYLQATAVPGKKVG